MLHTRPLLPLVSHPSQQWQLRALLRLPPELRQLALRTFSSSSPLLDADDLFETNSSSPVASGERNTNGPTIRRLLNRPPHGRNGKVDTQIRKLGRLRAVKDAAPPKALPRHIKESDTDISQAELHKKRRDGLGRQIQSTPASQPHVADGFVPFQDHGEVEHAFGALSTASKARGRVKESVRDHELGITEGSNGLGQLAGHPNLEGFNEEALHHFRTPSEVARYSRLIAELQKVQNPKARSNIENILRGMNKKAEGRQKRGTALEDHILDELKQDQVDEMFVHANGNIGTRQEMERKRQLSALEQQAAKDSDAAEQIRREVAVLDRKAHLRGVLLRQRAEESSDHGVSLRSRLNHLKHTLRNSPQSVADAPALQSQLHELEETLRESLKRQAMTPHQDGNSVRARLSQLEAMLVKNAESSLAASDEHIQRNDLGDNLRSFPNPASPDAMSSRIANTDSPLHPSSTAASLSSEWNPRASRASKTAARTTHESSARGKIQAQVTSNTQQQTGQVTPSTDVASEMSVPDSIAPQNAVKSPEDISVLADLSAQIQELNGLLKLLIPEQAGLQSTPALASSLAQVVAKANSALAAAPPGLSKNLVSGHYSSMGNSSTHLPNLPVTDFPVLPHELEKNTSSVNGDGAVQNTPLPTGSTLKNGLTQLPSAHVSEISTASQRTVDSKAKLEEIGSLYEQLFPEEAALASRDEPRDPLPRLTLPTEGSTSESPSPQHTAITRENERSRKSVLVLRSASKTLTEDDFRRAMPRGKHIQEWTQRGEYERVIPVRDFWTLERTGDYILVFQHRKAADAFLQHIKRIFELSKSYTPSSLTSELAPVGMDDEAELVRNFTLVPPSMPLILERDPGVRSEVLAKAGYPQALPGPLTAETPQVLLEMYGGPMPNWFQLRDAIARDGLRRGLNWDLITGDLAIRKLQMEASKRERGYRNAIESDYDANRSDVANELVARDNDGEYSDAYPISTTSSDDEKIAQDRLQGGNHGQRWALVFKEKEEAQRFARAWHMRGFPWADQENVKTRLRGVTRIKAEVLW